ncbi:HypC/HybG/HupF family hydrogenase formation chaperone [uncultured Rhodospira sp.]|uniref:HypC/HybG/HupF family hydrogenase formation chaperone n=1 Tax=uncultured Rhodospira sp. TaxID=1936189 RepID=UPI0026141AAF|nr:HypC/HybG/HupF family hydrogenase formation chaperone [uncultured Rhodospira sp.]
MCLAVPARVVELLPENMARVDAGGATKEVSVALVDDLEVGDYVLLHVGFALSRLKPEEAQKTLDLIASLTEEPAPS